jgi:hypothetical protein
MVTGVGFSLSINICCEQSRIIIIIGAKEGICWGFHVASTIPEKLTPGGFKMTINSMVILPKDYIDRKLIELKKAGKSIHISSNHRKSDRQLVCSSCDLCTSASLLAEL